MSHFKGVVKIVAIIHWVVGVHLKSADYICIIF